MMYRTTVNWFSNEESMEGINPPDHLDDELPVGIFWKLKAACFIRSDQIDGVNGAIYRLFWETNQ